MHFLQRSFESDKKLRLYKAAEFDFLDFREPFEHLFRAVVGSANKTDKRSLAGVKVKLVCESPLANDDISNAL